MLKLAKTFHLLEDMLQQLLAAHDVEMAFDLGVFLGKTVDFFLREATTQACIELARELVHVSMFAGQNSVERMAY